MCCLTGCRPLKATKASPSLPCLTATWVWSMGGVVRRLEDKRKEKPRDFFPPPSQPWRHLCVISCQRSLPRLQLPPRNPAPWALVTLPLPCVAPLLFCFRPLVIPRLPQCFFYGFQLSYHLWNKLPELNFLHLSCTLVCVLLVGPWLIMFPFKYLKFAGVYLVE